MSVTTAPSRVIGQVSATACTLPVQARSGYESDGTLQWTQTTIVLVCAHCGDVTGYGYTYADASTVSLIDGTLAGVVGGIDALATERAWWAMAGALRNSGRPGMAMRAVSAIDIALWDLKARLLDVSLAELLGAVRDRVAVYGSGGFCSSDDDELSAQVTDWRAAGIDRVKMKVGRDPADDDRRVALVRGLAGGCELMVDANGAWTVPQALGTLHDWSERFGVVWAEEPVSSDDRRGLRRVREGAPAGVQVAAGEYASTPDDVAALLTDGCVDVLQVDATRCGGVTGVLNAAAQCVAAHMPLSLHTSPSVHAHLGCALAPVAHIEWFWDHVQIERRLFDDALEPVDGALQPDRGRPGLGMTPRWDEVARWAA